MKTTKSQTKTSTKAKSKGKRTSAAAGKSPSRLSGVLVCVRGNVGKGNKAKRIRRVKTLQGVASIKAAIAKAKPELSKGMAPDTLLVTTRSLFED